MALCDGLTYPECPRSHAGDWATCMREGADRLRAGANADAVAAFAGAVALRPADPTTLLNYAAALLRADSVDQALTIYDRLVLDHPAQPKIHHARGLAFHAAGDRAAAIQAFHAAVSRDADAWRSWQSIADVTSDEAERRHAINRAADALTRVCAKPHAPAQLFRTCVSALIDAGLAAEAITFVDANAERFPDLAVAHDARARAWYRQGDFEAAFRSKLDMLEAMNLAAPPIAPFKPFIPGEAVIALRDVMDILREGGLSPFLTAGTLLGFHRDGAPLPHDRDVDIGVIRTAQTPDVVAIVRKSPALLLARDARPGDRYLALMHRGIGIDIFVHDEVDNHLLCGFSERAGDIQWRFSRFTTWEATYGDQQWRIPENPDSYLAETYGSSWQTPDTGFASAISSPALHEAARFARAYYAVARAVNAMRIGDFAKAKALVEQSPVPIPHPARLFARPVNEEGRP